MATVTYYMVQNEPLLTLTQQLAGQSFVRTNPNKSIKDHSFLLTALDVEAIKNNALPLVAVENNGSLKFFNSALRDYTILNEDWNDGNWVTLDRCLELHRTNSPNIRPVTIALHDNHED